jgi:hypothetical protein
MTPADTSLSNNQTRLYDRRVHVFHEPPNIAEDMAAP